MKSLWLLGLVALVSGCGKPDHPITASGGSVGGHGGTGGRSAISGAGGEGGTSAVPGAPVVVITSPVELASPNDGEVVITDEVDVLCTVTKSKDAGAKDVDPTTVKIAVLDADSMVVQEAAGAPTDNANEYTAKLIVTPIANGLLSFRCTAEEGSTPPKVGTALNSTFIDHGPNITVTTPAADSAYALMGVVPFEFTVSPAPLADGDTGATVDDVKLTVNGVPIDPTAGSGDTYTADIDFQDKTIFPDTPSGPVAVVIEGTDARMPTAVTRTLSYNFVIDGDGPVINITSHKDQQVIGGPVLLQFSVTDALSGVDSSSIVVQLNTQQNHYMAGDPWAQVNGVYSFSFDSRTTTGSKVQLTVNINASDKVGNPSAGASLQLYLDNQPPIVDLSPPDIREAKFVNPNWYCSNPFDPVGSQAVNDTERVQDFAKYRAIVWDQTNTALGQDVHYYAGTQQDSVRLYVQADAATALLVDKDNDGICDDIDEGSLTSPLLELHPVPHAGTAWYSNDSTSDPQLSGCIVQAASTVPSPLCSDPTGDLYRVISHSDKGNEPVIYGSGALTGLECTGGEWELSSIADGTWLCFAARAYDLAGNMGFSPPLRACHDNSGTNVACDGAPPTCTDGCTPPAGFAPAIIVPLN